MPTLENDIERYKLSFKEKVDVETQNIMIDATQELKKEDLRRKCLQIKDKIPVFSLLNATGDIIHIQDIIDKHKYTILSFYRGAWCPYCNLELKQLQKIQSELKILHAEMVALSPQTPDNSLISKEKNALTFEVLCDKNNAVAREFGIVYNLPEKLRPIYKSFGIDIIESNNNGTFDLPLPATFVVNNNYEIIYSFVNEDYTKRLEPRDILTAIKKDIINSH